MQIKVGYAFIHIIIYIALNFKSELKTINGGYSLELRKSLFFGL